MPHAKNRKKLEQALLTTHIWNSITSTNFFVPGEPKKYKQTIAKSL